MNYQLFELINGLAGRLDLVDDTMEFAATWLIYLIFAGTAVFVAVSLYRRRPRPVIELGVASFSAFAAATVVSHLSDQQRPFQTHHVHQLIAHAPGVSLPSDHATAAFTLAFGVGAFLSRGWGLIIGIAALVVGVSRIWVGVHYPGDIAGAAIIAALAVLPVVVGNRRRTTRPPAPSSAGGAGGSSPVV